jgi:hypothetical protein
MIGLSGSVASVNTMAMRVVSAATTNGPRSSRNPLTSASAAFWPADFFVKSGTLVALSVVWQPKDGKAASRDRCWPLSISSTFLGANLQHSGRFNHGIRRAGFHYVDNTT